MASPTDPSVASTGAPPPDHTPPGEASAVPGQACPGSSGDDSDGSDTLENGPGTPASGSGTADATVAYGSGSSAMNAVSGTSERLGTRWPQPPQNLSSSVSGVLQ